MAKVQNYLKISQIYQSVHFTLVLDTREQIEKLDTSVRVAHNRKNVYIRSGIKYTEQEFEKVMKGTKGENYAKKVVLIEFFNKVYNVGKKLIDDEMFTLQVLKNSIYGKAADGNLDDLFIEKIQSLKLDKKIKTAMIYETSYNKLKEVYKTEINLSSISPEFVAKFYDSMKGTLTSTTISIYLRNLRHICNIALSRGLIKQSQYPFSTKVFETSKVRIPKSAKRKGSFLDIETITKIYNYYIEFDPQTRSDKQTKEILAIWLFSYLANGMNLADMVNLKWDHHYFKTGGKELCFIRQKTKDSSTDEIVIYIPVIDYLKPILSHIGTIPKKNELIFPFLVDSETDLRKRIILIGSWSKLISKKMKIVCEILGIDETPSMTFARHSYQTNLAHQKVPGTYIDQQVGHTDRTITDTYIGLYSTEDRFTYNSLLIKL